MIQPYLNEQGFELVDIEYVKEGVTGFYGCMSTKKVESTSTIVS